MIGGNRDEAYRLARSRCAITTENSAVWKRERFNVTRMTLKNATSVLLLSLFLFFYVESARAVVSSFPKYRYLACRTRAAH